MSDRTEPVRIVHVTTVPSSLAAFFDGHFRYLRQRGFEVHAVSAPGAELEEFGRSVGAPVHAVPMARRITPLADLVALWRLVRLFRRLRPAVVHSHTPKGGLLGTAAAWLARVPVRVYTVHGLVHVARRGWRRWLLRRTERCACRLAQRVLAVSPSLRDLVVAEGLCPAERIAVIGAGSIRGVDARRFARTAETEASGRRIGAALGIPDEAPVLGFVGRVVRDKGAAELFEAFRTLRAEFPSLHLLLVGGYDDAQPLDPALRRALESEPDVHVVPFQRDLVPYLARMTVLALPSHRDGFGLALIEAAAMELATVASRIPGCVDAVQENVTGLLVEPRDARALAGALARLLRDAELRRRLGEAGRRRVEADFRPEEIYEGHVREYVRLLRAAGLPAPA